MVAERGGDCQRGLLEGLEVQVGAHEDLIERDRAGAAQLDLAPEAHVLVRRGRIPVHEAEGRIAGLGRVDQHRERVHALAQLLRDVELPDSKRTGQILPCADLAAIEPHVGAVVDSLQDQTGRGCQRTTDRELGAIPPGLLEWLGGDGLEVVSEVGIVDLAALEQRGDDRGRYGSLRPSGRVEADRRDRLPGRVRLRPTTRFCQPSRRVAVVSAAGLEAGAQAITAIRASAAKRLAWVIDFSSRESASKVASGEVSWTFRRPDQN